MVLPRPRSELQEILTVAAGKAYFQPPENLKMDFPCIVYQLSDLHTEFADNAPYARKKRYQITVIDADPDTDIFDKISALPMCSFDRFFTANLLNHFVFRLFF